jgi:hypothetical protein
VTDQLLLLLLFCISLWYQVSFFGDQFFWGSRVAGEGAGVHLRFSPSLSAAQLGAALKAAATDPAIRLQAERIGSHLRSEDGVGRAVGLINRHLANFDAGRVALLDFRLRKEELEEVLSDGGNGGAEEDDLESYDISEYEEDIVEEDVGAVDLDEDDFEEIKKD